MIETLENQDFTGRWSANFTLYQSTKTITGSITTFWNKRSANNDEQYKAEKIKHPSQEISPEFQRRIYYKTKSSFRKPLLNIYYWIVGM